MRITCKLFVVVGIAALLAVVGVSGQYFERLPKSALNQQQQALRQLRQQRSLYGGIAPIGVGHITKDELIALLEAWTEVENELKPKLPVEAVPDMVAESQEEEEEEDKDEGEAIVEGGGGAAAEKPLTVSLAAFVPIQLSATYTPPAESVGGVAHGIDEAPKSINSLFESAPHAGGLNLPAPIAKPLDLSTFKAQIKPAAQSLIKPPAASFLRSARPPIPQHGRIVPPPPPFLAHPPAPLELVPSTQLWSHWQG